MTRLDLLSWSPARLRVAGGYAEAHRAPDQP